MLLIDRKAIKKNYGIRNLILIWRKYISVLIYIRWANWAGVPAHGISYGLSGQLGINYFKKLIGYGVVSVMNKKYRKCEDRVGVSLRASHGPQHSRRCRKARVRSREEGAEREERGLDKRRKTEGETAEEMEFLVAFLFFHARIGL